MATITIKNIPDELYERLKAAAAANRRSVNNEIIIYIERTLNKPQPVPEELLDRMALIRDSIGYYITNDELTEWKDEGRQ